MQLRRCELRIADGFILREIADTWVVIPTGSKLVEFNGIINLSESGALLWNTLKDGACEDELVSLITREYQISEKEALDDVQQFVSELKQKGLLV